MSTRPASRWPVSRPAAALILSGVAGLALAGAVPATRGGLFLLALLAAACGLVVVNHRRRRA